MKDKAHSKSSGMHARSSRAEAEQILAEMLEIIRSHPGIRPSELNHRMNREQSDSLRATLIRRGLVRKVKNGQVTHLYAE
jgi:hypothetical protein